MATHSSILAWEIPWTEEPGGWQRVSHTRKGILHDLADQVSESCKWEEKSKTGEGQRGHRYSQQNSEIHCSLSLCLRQKVFEQVKCLQTSICR